MTAVLRPQGAPAPVTADPTCAATQRCANQPVPGLLVCRGHLERLGAMLREVEDEAAILSAVPSMQRQHGRSGSLASHRTPVRLDVVVHNDPRHGTGKSEDEVDELAAGETLSVLATLHSWARAVREDDERKLSAPERVTISGERDLLVRQLEWIAAQAWIDEFYADLSQLLGQLRTANGHRADRPHSSCPVLVGGETCPGNVWIQDELQPVWRRHTDRCAQTWEQAPGAAICDTCDSAWVTPGDKARLQRMIDDAAREASRPRTDDGRPMLTAEELVAQGIVSSVSNVRVTAHRRGVVSIAGHYDPAIFRERMAG